MTTHVAPQAKDWVQAIETDARYQKQIGYMPAAHGLTLAQNDIIQMVKVPIGAIVTDGFLLTGALGGSVTADVGDGNTEDLYISAVSVASASCTAIFESTGTAGVPYTYTVADTIDVKLEGANPSDSVAFALIVGYLTGVDITP
jgi:hypothetical protein